MIGKKISKTSPESTLEASAESEREKENETTKYEHHEFHDIKRPKGLVNLLKKPLRIEG